MLRQLLDAPRPTKRMISIAYDILALTASLYIAWALRIDSFRIPVTQGSAICLAITLAASIAAFIRLGLYRAILRYIAQDAVISIAIGILISSTTLAASSFFLNSDIPRSVPVIYLFTATLLIGLPRLMVRNIVQIFFPVGDTKVLVYGAGSAGRMLADSLRQSPEFQPIAFLEDNSRLVGNKIKGLPVYSSSEAETIISKYDCSKVFLALGSTERNIRQGIIRQLEQYPVQLQTIPPLEELTKGELTVANLQDIQIEDLLGRDPVEPNEDLLRANIQNKVVMVTGAGGSIGSELCRQISKHNPKTLLLFELNEYNLYKIEQELQAEPNYSKSKIQLHALLGSVQCQQRLESVMKHFHVETVYHAAAYKHVPLVEQNMVEGLQNNVFGTYHCAKAALASGVKTFVLISTDKAVRSTNIMGASKRLSEMVVRMLAGNNPSTRFNIVRFGNVLGSSGSVVPKFRGQIERGGPVTVTHPDVTRYFMTIPEAAQLVIQAGAMAKGGETYVLEMGEPVRIADLAKEMIRLSGYTLKSDRSPQGNIEISFTGLRPGEKLYEELLVVDNVIGTKHPRITEALEESIENNEIELVLSKLSEFCENRQLEKLLELLSSLPNTYSGSMTPNDSLSTGTSRKTKALSLIK